MWNTVNYLFAAYLQTKAGGSHKIVKVEKVKPGKAKFYFDIKPDVAEELQLKFHTSEAYEFEQFRKGSINLCY